MAKVSGAAAAIKKGAPAAIAFGGIVAAFLKEHPEAPERVRQQLRDAGGRLTEIRNRRSPAARIRGTLEVVRDTAGRLGDEDQDAWIARADRIELGVRLAESQAKAERRATLARLTADTDAMLADLLARLTGDRALPGA